MISCDQLARTWVSTPFVIFFQGYHDNPERDDHLFQDIWLTINLALAFLLHLIEHNGTILSHIAL